MSFIRCAPQAPPCQTHIYIWWPVPVYFSEISEKVLGNFLIISHFSIISLLLDNFQIISQMFLDYFLLLESFSIISRLLLDYFFLLENFSISCDVGWQNSRAQNKLAHVDSAAMDWDSPLRWIFLQLHREESLRKKQASAIHIWEKRREVWRLWSPIDRHLSEYRFWHCGYTKSESYARCMVSSMLLDSALDH